MTTGRPATTEMRLPDSPDSETMRRAAEEAECIMAGFETPEQAGIDSDALSAAETPEVKEEAIRHQESYVARGPSTSNQCRLGLTSRRRSAPPLLGPDIWQTRTLALDLWLPQSYQATLLLTHWLSPLRLPCLRSRRPAALEYDHHSRPHLRRQFRMQQRRRPTCRLQFSIGMPSPLGLHYDAVNARYRYKPGLGTSSILTSSSSSRNWSQGALPTRYDRTCCWLLENTLHERSHRQTQHCRVLPLLPDWAPVFPLSTAGGDVRPVLLICDACLRRSPCCAGFSILCTARPGSRRSFDDSRRVDRPSIEAEHIVATMVLCLSRKPPQPQANTSSST